MTEGQRFLNVKEAAIHLGFRPATLDMWRSDGKGPVYFKMGPSVRYRLVDLDRWGTAEVASRKALEEAAECHRIKRESTKRPRGRTGAAERARRLATEPFCSDCLEAGSTRLAEEIDHIIPLAQGGSNEDGNVRSLCKPCHAVRTRTQTLVGGATV